MTDCPVILTSCRVQVKLSSDPATQQEEEEEAAAAVGRGMFTVRRVGAPRGGPGTSAAFPEQARLACEPRTADILAVGKTGGDHLDAVVPGHADRRRLPH